MPRLMISQKSSWDYGYSIGCLVALSREYGHASLRNELTNVCGIMDTQLHAIDEGFTHLQALDSCRLDRMPHVRAAVSEALHTAKMLASGDPTRTSVGIAASPVRKSSERGRGGWHEDALLSPASKRGHSPRSPASSTSASESRQIPSSPARSTDRRPKRIPLHSARGMGFVQSPRSASSPSSSPSSSITEECESPSHRCECRNFQEC